MKRTILVALAAIFLGYLGTVLGDEYMNWPQFGPILSLVTMGCAILTAIDKKQ